MYLIFFVSDFRLPNILDVHKDLKAHYNEVFLSHSTIMCCSKTLLGWITEDTVTDTQKRIQLSFFSASIKRKKSCLFPSHSPSQICLLSILLGFGTIFSLKKQSRPHPHKTLSCGYRCFSLHHPSFCFHIFSSSALSFKFQTGRISEAGYTMCFLDVDKLQANRAVMRF